MCNCTNCRCNKQCEDAKQQPQKGGMTPELYKYWYEGGLVEELYTQPRPEWKKVSDNFLIVSLNGLYRKGKVPHKHAELIKAWADGAVIQGKTKDANANWYDHSEEVPPRWYASVEYRVKPD